MDFTRFGEALFGQFARIGSALASDRRLQLLDLLTQAPRYVDALAAETGMSVANTSQHLQALRAAGLVEAERDGNRVRYAVSEPAVIELWDALRRVAASRLAEVDRLRQDHSALAPGDPQVSRSEVRALIENNRVVVIDVRPEVEFEHGHLEGALSLPLARLDDQLGELPRDRPIVAYCRGEYCLMADEAVARLRAQGFDAMRVEGGWLELMLEDYRAAEASR